MFWLCAVMLFVAVAGGTQYVLRGQTQPSAPVAAAPHSVFTSPAGGVTAALPMWAHAPVLTAQIVIYTTQQMLINQDRVLYGRSQLHWSTCLASIAHSNAVRMATQGYISHTNGPTRDLGCHLGYHAGENVGWYQPLPSDRAINTAFMASPTHRANIMSRYYHYVGTSWVKGSNGHWYIAVEFG